METQNVAGVMEETEEKPMRILVITDTHGHLSLINSLAQKHNAGSIFLSAPLICLDVVLHCGDFGIYSEDEEALKRVPDRELSLRISHAEHLPLEVRLLHCLLGGLAQLVFALQKC
jgi:hypothetical protein